MACIESAWGLTARLGNAGFLNVDLLRVYYQGGGGSSAEWRVLPRAIWRVWVMGHLARIELLLRLHRAQESGKIYSGRYKSECSIAHLPAK